MPQTALDSLGYNDWRQVGGYFDGDGCVIVQIRQFVLILYLQWTDGCREHLEQIDRFLHSIQGISTRIYRDAVYDAYHLMVTRQDSVLRIAKEMLPFTFKKKVELEVVVDYYGDRITGNEGIALLNQQIERGFRSANKISANLPLTHKKAVARARRRSNLTDFQVEEIHRMYGNGCSVSELALAYGKSAASIRKIVTNPN